MMSTKTSILIGLFFLSSSLSLAACLELDLKEVTAEDMTAQDMIVEDMTLEDMTADDVIAGDMTAQDMMVTSCGDGRGATRRATLHRIRNRLNTKSDCAFDTCLSVRAIGAVVLFGAQPQRLLGGWG